MSEIAVDLIRVASLAELQKRGVIVVQGACKWTKFGPI